MKYLHLYESWLDKINPFKKKEIIQEEPPKDQFIAAGMEDPTDPKSQFSNYREGEIFNFYKDGVNKLIDISKYYNLPDFYNGRGWIFHILCHDLVWLLEEMEDLNYNIERIHDIQFMDYNREPAYAKLYRPIYDEEPILSVSSRFQRLGLWIPKSILETHFKNEESAKAYISSVKSEFPARRNLVDFGFMD